MWILLACGSAVFAGLTSILAKVGVRHTDSHVATAIRTIVVLVFSWLMVFIVGSQDTLSSITPRSMLFLILSGVATGASWLCYFKALQLGDVNKVVPVDKSSTILTVLMAMLIFHETANLPVRIVGTVMIAAGTYLMVDFKSGKGKSTSIAWLVYAVLSAVFAALTSILAKVGIENVESNLGTAIRTGVVLVMSWLVVGVTGKLPTVKHVEGRDLVFICLSGIATGASWLCYYRALQLGQASVVVPIDKLSILLTVAFAHFVLKEKTSIKTLTGLVLITLGTLGMAIFA